jgi:hypothetical protein
MLIRQLETQKEARVSTGLSSVHSNSKKAKAATAPLTAHIDMRYPTARQPFEHRLFRTQTPAHTEPQGTYLYPRCSPQPV